jgi:hypothetical protein
MDVTLHDPSIALAAVSCETCADRGDRILGASIRGETIGMMTKVRFPDGF